jgi:hypothetical protein
MNRFLELAPKGLGKLAGDEITGPQINEFSRPERAQEISEECVGC